MKDVESQKGDEPQRKTNYIDFLDDARALISCCNLNIHKTGFWSANDGSDGSDVCYVFPSNVCNVLTIGMNIFLTPFLLAAHFVRIYMFPAVTIVFSRIIMSFCCTLNMCSFKYYDYDFPPVDRSVGVLDKHREAAHERLIMAAEKPHSVSNLDCWYTGIWHMLLVNVCTCFKPDMKYEWQRAVDLSVAKGGGDEGEMKLFEGGIDANDICQGKLGDCWLMATMAAAADQAGLIENLFLSRERSLCGYYKLKLYDIYSGGTPRWRVVTIDDSIPVKKGTKTPLFAQPSGRELWVLLLEKAYAKLMGSYERMDGGHPIEAMRVFTGCTPVRYMKPCCTVKGKYSATGGANVAKSPDLEADHLWNVIDAGCNHGMILCAANTSGGSVREGKGSKGLIKGHAYTILDTHKLKRERKIGQYGIGTKIIQLRNPWGSGEWTGPFGDNDEEFWEHSRDGKNMSKRGQAIEKVDGCFWMPFEEFLENVSAPPFHHTNHTHTPSIGTILHPLLTY